MVDARRRITNILPRLEGSQVGLEAIASCALNTAIKMIARKIRIREGKGDMGVTVEGGMKTSK